ncbi:MAG: alpha-amylase family glycosyl hydrolase, partial [Clostridia bacterium]|nr:alpha-amylase family glycosyl hydrolase [Clostridia bacterium]
MPEHIYNSRDRHYKSIYGAIAVHQTVRLRLLLPENFGGLDIYDVNLVISNDANAKVKTYALTRTNDQYAGSFYWELNYTPTEAGLFWYHFEFTAGGYHHNIFKGMYSNGYVDGEDDSWQLTVYSGEQVVANQWKGGIMYQIFPDRFYSSGSKKIVPMEAKLIAWGSMPQYEADPETGLWNNDYQGGDLRGIEEKLPYLASLGVDIIYLNPIFEAHSNHRYNTADYKAIDPLL